MDEDQIYIFLTNHNIPAGKDFRELFGQRFSGLIIFISPLILRNTVSLLFQSTQGPSFNFLNHTMHNTIITRAFPCQAMKPQLLHLCK